MRGGVDERVRDLGDRLRGPARVRDELLVELRDALTDAVEAYRAAGLSEAEAERRAVAEFGSPARLLPAYQAELAAAALRALSVRALPVALLLVAAGDLTWRGSSWSDGPRPPAGYLLLSGSMHAIWLTVAGLALAALAAGSVGARRGLAEPPVGRLLGWGLTGVLAVGMVSGVALFGWSVRLWDAALTWPPMLIGVAVAGAAWFPLVRATRWWVAAAR